MAGVPAGERGARPDATSVCSASGRVLLEIEGLIPDPSAVRSPIGRVAVSRFAIVRVDGGRLVAEHPLSRARAVLVDPAVGSLVAQLATPTDVAAPPVAPGLGAADAAEVTAWLFAIGVVVADGADDVDPVARLREPHDVWFHAASRRGGRPRSLGSTWRGRDQERPPPPAVAAPEVVAWHELAQPAVSASDPGVLTTLAHRRSRREFGPLDADQLGAVLWHSLRILERRTDAHGWEITKRPFASGGGCHDLDAYVVAGTVDGLASGVWWYDPQRHRLGSLGCPPLDVGRALLDATTAMGVRRPPPAMIVLGARFDRTVWKYEGIAYALTLKHVGAAMATIGLVSEALSLSACPLGLGDAEWFAGVSGAHPLVVSSVGELALGGRADG